MKKTILSLAKDNLIDEIRFVDVQPLGKKHVGDPALFKGRQAQEIMPAAKSIILACIYIGKFITPVDQAHARMGRLTLSGCGANIIDPLKPIAQYLQAKGYAARIENDAISSTTLPLKGTAVKAGLGWIGKNTLLINQKYGSFLALGAILTNAELQEEYLPAVNRCGNCTKCVEACPTNSLVNPRHLDRPKCLSHIMDGGKPCKELAKLDTQNYVLGCDLCQNACPWNRSHIEQPLATPYGDYYNMSAIEPLLKIERLRCLTSESYLKELVPQISAAAVPFDVFANNITRLCACFKAANNLTKH